MISPTNETSTNAFTSDWVLTNVTCVSRKKTGFLLFAILPSLAIIINVVVLVAVALDSRRLLRQNRVYAHVSSTLIANVTFAFLALLQILSLYFNFEGYRDDPFPGHQGAVRPEMAEWWAFRKAFLYGVYIIMCGNIGFLIEAIRSGICGALRSAAGAVRIRSRPKSRWLSSSRHFSSTTHDTAVPSSRVMRRRRSYISIAILWTLSLVYVVIPTAGWSCAHACTCLSSCFPEDQIRNPPVRGCSRALPPMANSWLAATIGLWATCLLGVFILLRRSVIILKKAVQRHVPEEYDSVFYDPNEHIVTLDITSRSDESSRIQEDSLQMAPKNCEVSMHQIYEGVALPSVKRIDGESDVAENEKKNYSSGCKNSNRMIEGETSDTKSRSKSTMSSTSFFSGIFRSDRRGLLSRRSQRKADTGHLLNVESKFKHVIWLTILYACTTAPPMAYMIADMAVPSMKMNMVFMNVCLLFPFVYCIVCPFLLIKCLPGVKVSIEHLVLKMCMKTSTVKRGSTQIHSACKD